MVLLLVHRSHLDIEGLGDLDQVVRESLAADGSDDSVSQMRN